MTWDFSTEPAFEADLEWMRGFVREEVVPLELLHLNHDQVGAVLPPLQALVKARGLWASHLPHELGGGGFGQVRLALMNEIIGVTEFAPSVFGNQAPDSGNAELIALGTQNEVMRERWLYPLLEGRLRSAFSMTEYEVSGADPTHLLTTAVLDGDGWVINGHKWFTSNGSVANFFIVMCVTDPTVSGHLGASMIIVPADTPGVDIVRDIPTMAHPEESYGRLGNHAEIYYRDVRVPYENVIGKPGDGFVLAQKRLGPGRIHHVMRWIGQCQRALDMLCERAVTRQAAGSALAEKQFVQNYVADSVAELHALRLMTLHAAWTIDQVGSSAARVEIAMIKYFGAKVLHDVIDRALQVHGSLGFSTDMPLEAMYRIARAARIYDGPDEVHKVTVARKTLARYKPVDVPTEHVPTRLAEARVKYAHLFD
jgi:acyl-CoA dehydrogenase